MCVQLIGYKTSYEYDFRNRLVLETDAKGEETKYKYDGVGNLISLTDRNNNTTKYEYDALNRQFKTIDAEDGGFHYGLRWLGGKCLQDY